MLRKVFISFLGTTDYFPSMYYRGKKFCSGMEMIEVAASYDALRRLRNDVNHFGFDDWDPKTPTEIERVVKEEFNSITHALGICLST